MNTPVVADATRNLRKVSCPMNLVYTKVELSKLSSGQVLEVILDDGAPINNVPGSVLKEGHAIISQEQLADSAWVVFIRKK